jgi:hypothetical protein
LLKVQPTLHLVVLAAGGPSPDVVMLQEHHLQCRVYEARDSNNMLLQQLKDEYEQSTLVEAVQRKLKEDGRL